MNTTRFGPRQSLIAALFLVILVLTACAGSPETWPGIAGVAENDRVIVSFRKTIVSLSAENERLWTYPDDDKSKYQFFAPAVVADGRVYVGDYSANIHAIDAETGQRIWIYEPERSKVFGFTLSANDRVIGPIAVGDGKLFYGNEHGVVALDIAEAEPRKLWSFETDHSVWGQPLYINDEALNATPALIVTSLDHRIYSLDPKDGSKQWEVKLDGAIPGGVTLDTKRKLLYAGTLSAEVVAIRLADGTIADRYETEGWVWGNPALFEDKLYFGDLRGFMYEVTLADSDEVFGESFRRQLASEPLRATPLIVQNLPEDGEASMPVLVIGSEDGKVYAFNLAGTNWIQRGGNLMKWSRDVKSKAVTDLAWVDRTITIEGEGTQSRERLVIVGTEETDRLVVALRLNDGGDEVWHYKYDD